MRSDANRSSFIDRLISERTWPPQPNSQAGATPPVQVISAQLKPPRASGFKVFLKHLTREEFVGLAFSPGVRKLVLRRSNLVDIFVSAMKARRIGEYAQRNTTDVRLAVDKDSLIEYIGGVERENSCVDAARRHSTELFGGQDWHSLDYATLVNLQTAPAILQGALNHILPVSMRVEQPPSVERMPLPEQDLGDRRGAITNFQQLCAQLRSEMPRYFAMLMEGLDPSACAPAS